MAFAKDGSGSLTSRSKRPIGSRTRGSLRNRPAAAVRWWAAGGALGARATCRVIRGLGCDGAKNSGPPLRSTQEKSWSGARDTRAEQTGVGGIGAALPVNRLDASARLLFSKGREDIVGERNEAAVLCPIGFGRGPQHSLQSHEEDFGQHGSLLVKHPITLSALSRPAGASPGVKIASSRPDGRMAALATMPGVSRCSRLLARRRRHRRSALRAHILVARRAVERP